MELFLKNHLIYRSSAPAVAERSLSELAEEKVEAPEKLRVYHSGTGKTTEYLSVAFTDPRDPEETVTLRLTEAMVGKLAARFDPEDWVRRENDGVIRLQGKAESFLSGWYDEMAHRRGYLAADLDGNGSLDDREFSMTRSGMELEMTFYHDKKELLATEVDVARHYLQLSKMGTLAMKIDGATLEGLTEAQIRELREEIDTANAAASVYRPLYNMASADRPQTLEEGIRDSLEADRNMDGTIDGDEYMAFHGQKKSYAQFLGGQAQRYYDQSDERLAEAMEPGKEVGEATLMTLEEKEELLQRINEMKAANRAAEAKAAEEGETEEPEKTQAETAVEEKAVAQYRQTQLEVQVLLFESGSFLEETA